MNNINQDKKNELKLHEVLSKISEVREVNIKTWQFIGIDINIRMKLYKYLSTIDIQEEIVKIYNLKHFTEVNIIHIEMYPDDIFMYFNIANKEVNQ